MGFRKLLAVIIECPRGATELTEWVRGLVASRP